MKPAARIEAPGPVPASQSRVPDTFTLHFHRTPEGWRVDGSATGNGHYAYEAFCNAFCNLADRNVAATGQASAPPDASSQKEGAL
ncbi:hypothetical protein D7X74_21790 [Corallococcus sp. CA047B]|uniref:hypothetical protein n=1 Tax=Corallococcus sp. CA047B TaxID=2316729 RepID=UPI000EA29FC6|nr:hypothetical protein [Corallococcus sp. CA047B]RKH13499.1 hypothetical protein D7X74_21790 [Corallococcus sp. CA047B]